MTKTNDATTDHTADPTMPRAVGRRAFARGVGVGGVALLAGGALRADRADAATGSWNLAGNAGTAPASNFVGTTDAQPLVLRTNNVERARVLSTGQVGVGLTTPTAKLHVKATSAIAFESDATAPGGSAIVGKSTGTSNTAARGVTGSVTDQGYGVRGDAGSGYGVFGNATNATGAGVGAFGPSRALVATTGTNGIAVAGTANGAGATAVYGQTDAGFGVLGACAGAGTGVRAQAGAGGSGVYGFTTGDSASSHGVWGTVPNHGYGVRGEAGAGFGVFGLTTAAGGIAVGGNGAEGGTGVKGQVPNTGYGVYGSAGVGYGVYGTAAANGVAVGGAVAGTGYGVKGVSNGAGVGVYGSCADVVNGLGGLFDGDVRIQNGSVHGGVLEVGDGTYLNGDVIIVPGVECDSLNVSGPKFFRIDHPRDPANKFLVHACIESDEVLNVYRGTAVLDAHGRATVELPAYFDALNRDATVQLTGVGPAPVHIARAVRDGSFEIGGEAGQEVHWQVTAARHDAHMRAHPMQVERDKAPHERGYYVAPELHGASPERRMHPARRTARPSEETSR